MDRDRALLVATNVVLALLGVALCLWGAFLVPLRVLGVEGLADVVAFGGNLVAGLLGAAGTGRAPTAAMPGLGWLAVVLVLGGLVPRPEGDVVIPSRIGNDPGVGTVGTLFLFAGAAGLVVAVVLAARRFRPVG